MGQATEQRPKPPQHWARDWHVGVLPCGTPFLLPGLSVIVVGKAGLNGPVIESVTCFQCRSAAQRELRGK